MHQDIEIRLAKLSDAESLYHLFDFWYNNYFSEDKSKGHLYLKKKYTLSKIKKIVLNGYATVAVVNGAVVSYYFVNPFFETGNLIERETIIKEKIKIGELPEGKYIYSLLSATNENYLGRGLNKQTLNLLRDLMKKEYDYFVGVMSYDNIPTQKSSIKMGWKHFGDIG